MMKHSGSPYTLENAYGPKSDERNKKRKQERQIAKDADNSSKRREPGERLDPAVLEQRKTLDHLMQHVDTPIIIAPIAPKLAALPPPKELLRNVPGSVAGAGSGDFHVYRAIRRREATRNKLMDEEARLEQEKLEFEARRAAAQAAVDEKTARNRAKRQKKKAKTQQRPRNTTSASNSCGEHGGPATLDSLNHDSRVEVSKEQ